MQRVAALYLPNWPIDRLRQAERRAGPPEPPRPPASPDPLREAVAKEQENACSVPRGGGWRPGARWAREERERHIAALPEHQRPSIRQLGRCDEAAGNPFKPMRSDEVGKQIPAGKPDRPVKLLPAAPLVPAKDALVTSIREGNRMVVAAASPEARALGVVPGMAITQARVQTPGLDIRPADIEGDLAALERLALLAARRWSPTVAIEGADCLLIDLSGVAHLHGGEARMAKRILRLLARRGFAARLAIADTAGAAWALAHHAHVPITCCPPGKHERAIAPLPVAALRTRPSAVELLKRLGVDCIGQLTKMPRAPLVKRFGAGLVARLAQALGEMPEPLRPIVPAEPITIRQRFAEPIATPEAIAYWLSQLVPRLATALEAEGLGVTRIELIAARIDGVPQRIRIGLARPSRDPEHLLKLLSRRIEDVEPGYGIDALALHARRAGTLTSQPVAERIDEEAAPDLAPLVDTLATRIGANAMWRHRPVESDVPERSVARAGVLDPPERAQPRGKPDDVRQLERNPGLHPWHPEWPKPTRLLRRPERLDHVMAELPDHAPRRFTWRGTAHQVVCADGPERVHGEWWKRSSETCSVRDYFRVEDEGGCRYWLFRKGDGERAATGDQSWYLHGVFG